MDSFALACKVLKEPDGPLNKLNEFLGLLILVTSSCKCTATDLCQLKKPDTLTTVLYEGLDGYASPNSSVQKNAGPSVPYTCTQIERHVSFLTQKASSSPIMTPPQIMLHM